METFQDVISTDQLVLVDFYATWCQPCKMMHPILEQVKKTLGDKIRIIKVDVDQHNDTATNYRVQAVPTLLLFKQSRPSGYAWPLLKIRSELWLQTSKHFMPKCKS